MCATIRQKRLILKELEQASEDAAKSTVSVVDTKPPVDLSAELEAAAQASEAAILEHKKMELLADRAATIHEQSQVCGRMDVSWDVDAEVE